VRTPRGRDIWPPAASLRSVLYYAIAGALIGALAYFMTDVSARIAGNGPVVPITLELQWLTAAGIIAGFVYWLIAGRKAGKLEECVIPKTENRFSDRITRKNPNSPPPTPSPLPADRYPRTIRCLR
jgi:hypothetical protein